MNNCRAEYDIKNEQLFSLKSHIDVLFIGDSITNNWELPLFFSDLGVVINRGIGANTVDVVESRLEGDVVQLNPRLVVMMVGLNNTIYFPDSENPENKAEKVLDSVTASYERIILSFNENKIPLIISSILPIRGFSEIRNRTIKNK